MWSWLACFGLLRRVAPSNVDVWRHQSSHRKREGRNVGVEVTEKQKLQLGFFFARAFLNSNDTVMSVQRQTKRPIGKNTNGVFVRSDMVSNNEQKTTLCTVQVTTLDRCYSVSLIIQISYLEWYLRFKQREEPYCGRLGRKTVQYQNFGEICYPNFRAKYGGRKAPPKVGTHLPDYAVP